MPLLYSCLHLSSSNYILFFSIAKEVVAERYGSEKITKPDMLGSFVAHGLSQKDAESESLVQM
jgi:hypothetical protein